MKTILFVFVFAFVFVNTYGQNQEKKKLTRKERKELRLRLKEEKIRLIDSAINNRQYVLEADYIMNKKGESFSVSSNINFVCIDSSKATFQFGSTYLIGLNGIGGVTVEGDITSYKVTKRKSGSYYIRISVSSSVGFYDISINITSTGLADADISTISSKRINYSGKIVPLQQSFIYKGRSY
jgi:hypothetical protein